MPPSASSPSWSSSSVRARLRLAVLPDPTNLLNIGRGIAIVGIVAVGETIVIISGGFDLSVGSIMAAAGMAAGYLVDAGVPLPIAFAARSGIGVAVGLVNGVDHQLRRASTR